MLWIQKKSPMVLGPPKTFLFGVVRYGGFRIPFSARLASQSLFSQACSAIDSTAGKHYRSITVM